jgi:hypothetical protein
MGLTANGTPGSALSWNVDINAIKHDKVRP